MKHLAALLLVLLPVASIVPNLTAQTPLSARPIPGPRWVASWATAMMPPEPQNNQPGLDPARLTDVTVRQIVHLSLGGSSIRLHLSNAFGTQPLRVEKRLRRPRQGSRLQRHRSRYPAAGPLQRCLQRPHPQRRRNDLRPHRPQRPRVGRSGRQLSPHEPACRPVQSPRRTHHHLPHPRRSHRRPRTRRS